MDIRWLLTVVVYFYSSSHGSAALASGCSGGHAHAAGPSVRFKGS